jgi:hypothetical protein
MTKNRRSLSVIADEIHKLQRVNLFALGELFLEAKDACEHGEWLPWIEEQGWSADSAERAMKVARLGQRFRKLRNLSLAKSTFYDLAELADENQDELAAIVEALAATKQHLKPADAEHLINLVRLRCQFGDFPDATLSALDDISPPSREWHATAIQELKAKRPTTHEAADEIVHAVRRDHLVELFAPHGELPDIPTDALHYLEDLPEQRRARVLQRLRDAEQPLTEGRIRAIIWSPQVDETDEDDDFDDDEDEDDDDEESEDDVVPPSAPMESELLEALKTVLQYARRPVPKATGGISGADLIVIEQFISELYASMQSRDAVKLAADRAEARRLRTPGAAA